MCTRDYLKTIIDMDKELIDGLTVVCMMENGVKTINTEKAHLEILKVIFTIVSG